MLLCITFICVGLSQHCYSQSFVLNNGFTNGQTIVTSSGIFYDDGDSIENYSDNINYTVTFAPNSFANKIKISFSCFSVDNSDTLWVYDGASTSAPLLHAGPLNYSFFNNSNSLNANFVVASNTNTEGSLTFRFKSNSSINSQGWIASISCISSPCQLFFAGIDSIATFPHPQQSFSSLTDTINFINTCFGESNYFKGKGNYPQNNQYYSQSDTSCTYYWKFGDGTVDSTSGAMVSHVFQQVHGYNLQLSIRDTHGCFSANQVNIRIKVSGNPFTYLDPLVNICSGDSVIMPFGYIANSTFQMGPIVSIPSSSQHYDSTKFIPDGPYCDPSNSCYNETVLFNCYMPGQTITAASDVLSVCMNFEHSYCGDLALILICPNNQQTILKTYLGSGQVRGWAHLGIPFGGDNHLNFDNGCLSIDNPPGIGWNYCWSQLYSATTTLNNQPSSTVVDSTNTINNTGYFIPDQSFANLIGCPLNGQWTMKICDLWMIDNGYVFSWDLNLAPNLQLPSWEYTVHVDTVLMSGPYFHIQSDTSAVINPPTGNNYLYHVSLIDDFGCQYDTIFHVNVFPTPFVNLGPDTSFCEGQYITLNAGSMGSNYNWSNGVTGPDSIIYVNNSGQYWVSASNTIENLTCTSSDTIQINMLPSPLSFFSSSINDSIVSFSNLSLNADTYLWDFGDGGFSTEINPNHSFNLPGFYNVILSAINPTCGTATFSNSINILSTSVYDFENTFSFRIFPNPSKGAVTIEIDDTFLLNLKLIIFNSLGQIVFRKNIDCKSFQEKLDLSMLQSGIYSVHLISDSINLNGKLVICN